MTSTARRTGKAPSPPSAANSAPAAFTRACKTYRPKKPELCLQTPDTAAQPPTPAELATVAQEIERVIAETEPQQAKVLLRLLIAELRVNGKADIQPTYRIITQTTPSQRGFAQRQEKWAV